MSPLGAMPGGFTFFTAKIPSILKSQFRQQYRQEIILRRIMNLHIRVWILKLKSLSLLFMAFVFLMNTLGCSSKSAMLHKYSYDCWGSFDTVITIMGYSSSQSEFDRWTQAGEQRFLELHKLYDKYNDYSGINNIKTINDMAGTAPVAVEPDLYNLIQSSLDWQARSPDAVNIALGPVLEVWHNYRTAGLLNPGQARLPTREELTAAAEHTDSSRIILDPEKQTIYLPDTDMRLDVGAVAKGYATEIVAEELEKDGWQSFVISSGGNVRTSGPPSDGVRTKWGVGIQNVTQDTNEEGVSTTDLVETVYLTNQSVVTSGDYQRYYIVDGQKYHHIIDPDTLMPADAFRSVSVITPDSGYADFLSTTFFILSYEEGLAFAATLDQVDVMWIFTDGSVKTTEGMRQYMKSAGAAWE